jgi:spore coat protein CotH
MNRYHKRIRKRVLLFSAGMLVLGVALFIFRKPLVSYWYSRNWFGEAFSNSRMMTGAQTTVLNFNFSFRDMEFFNKFSEEDASSIGGRQKVGLTIGSDFYNVDMMPFLNYFTDARLNKRKNAFTIRFPVGDSLDEDIQQWDLFQVKGVDYYRQELIYLLGHRLKLYTPETRFVNVYINFTDYGDYALKQSYDASFLEHHQVPDSVIFMLKPAKIDSHKKQKDKQKFWAIRFLYNETRSNRTEAYLQRFLELLRKKDGVVLIKYFDLDYIARFEAMRQLLNAETGFLLENNVRFVYSRLNGKLYPILDESNIYNLKTRKQNKSFAVLSEQIAANQMVQEKVRKYLKELKDNYYQIKNDTRKLEKKYSRINSGLLYWLRRTLVSEYFNSIVYAELRAGRFEAGKTRQGSLEISGSAYPRSSKDKMVRTPRDFIDAHKHLKMELVNRRIRLNPGSYTIKKDLVLPISSIFEISAGTTIKLGPGVSIICYGTVEIDGTQKNPVVIAPLDYRQPFGVFAIIGNPGLEEEVCRIDYLDLSGGSRAVIDGVKHSGGLDIYNINVEITNSAIHHNRDDSGLDIKNAIVRVENNAFFANHSDQLSLDFCSGIVKNNRFYNPGGDFDPNGDGLSVRSSELLIASNQFSALPDKGVSVGKHSTAVIYSNHFIGNRTGLASRDRGQVLLLRNHFSNNTLAVDAYQKKTRSGGGTIYMLPNDLVGNTLSYRSDTFSKIFRLMNRPQDERSFKELMRKGNTAPLFAAFTRLRFRLRPRKNRLEEFRVGSVQAHIDDVQKVVFAALPSGSSVRQIVEPRCTREDTVVYITPIAYGTSQNSIAAGMEKKVSRNRVFNFQEYIFRGQLKLVHHFQEDTYLLVITTGRLPLVEIDTSDSNGIPREIKNEPKIPCLVRFLGVPQQEGENSQVVTGYRNDYIEGRIEGRGSKRPKWKFGITLERQIAPMGLRKSKRWVLESSYVDKSLMRNKIAFDLYDQFRDPQWKRIAPGSRFVEVILNGDYHGVYLLMEHVDRNFLGLADFDRNEPLNAFMYRARNRNANFSRFNHKAEQVMKGYKDFPGGFQPTEKKWDPIKGWASGFEQRYPDPEQFGEYWQPIKEFSKFSALASDNLFQQKIVEYLNIGRYINMWILIQLLDDSDGLYQNRYYAREKGQTQFYVIPWDKDSVFGRDVNMNPRPHYFWLRTPLFDRLCKIDWFRKAFKGTWKTLRNNGVISEKNLFEMIDRHAVTLLDPQKRNFKRWPTDSDDYPDSYDFYQELDDMKDWIKKRILWLDEQIEYIHLLDTGNEQEEGNDISTD